MFTFEGAIVNGLQYMQNAQQSNFARALGANWLEPIPQGDRNGHTWSQVTIKDAQGSIKSYHKHTTTNDLYKADSNGWALIKAIGIAYTGQYYFGAALTRHLGGGAFKAATALKDMWEDYRIYKGQAGFDYKTFAKNRFVNFNPAFEELKQAGKDLVGFGLFYFNPTFLEVPIGAIATTLAVSYAVYAPLNTRVYLNRFEAWWRSENVRPLTDRQIEQLSVLDAVKHLTDGSYSLSHLFKMHKVEIVKSEEQKEEAVAERTGDRPQATAMQQWAGKSGDQVLSESDLTDKPRQPLAHRFSVEEKTDDSNTSRRKKDD